MARILLTGCAGFIGSHLSERLLQEGEQVIGIDNFDEFYNKATKLENLKKSLENKRFSFFEVDIRDRESLSSIGLDFDVIIHLAAKAGVIPSLADPEGYISTNIIGTKNILELMRVRSVKKLIFGSSSSVYGNNKSIPFREDDRVDEPISPYAFTKRACELINYSYHHLYDLNIINLRFFTVYGPRQRPDLAIHKFTQAIDNGLPITLYGEGSTARDYTYVDDTTSGICQALQFALRGERFYETLNIGNSYPIELSELVRFISEAMGKKAKIIKAPHRAGDVNKTFADISRANQLLGYQPRVKLEEGLRKFIAWYYEQKR